MENQYLLETSRAKETGRLEAFSDGIFCVAITLLAIEIGIEFKKDETNQGLMQALIKRWPALVAYFISFTNVLLAWMGHHELFKKLRDSDKWVMTSNGLLLLLVALVPFPTRTLGLYLLTGASQTAIIFYTGYFVLISLGFKILWWTASRNGNLLVRGLPPSEIKKVTRQENLGLLFNILITAIAFLNPWAALVLSFLMWIFWMVNG